MVQEAVAAACWRPLRQVEVVQEAVAVVCWRPLRPVEVVQEVVATVYEYTLSGAKRVSVLWLASKELTCTLNAQ